MLNHSSLFRGRYPQQRKLRSEFSSRNPKESFIRWQGRYLLPLHLSLHPRYPGILTYYLDSEGSRELGGPSGPDVVLQAPLHSDELLSPPVDPNGWSQRLIALDFPTAEKYFNLKTDFLVQLSTLPAIRKPVLRARYAYGAIKALFCFGGKVQEH
jgi:hypothetical protein